MKYIRTVIHVCFALSLAACGGRGLSIDLPGRGQALDLNFPSVQAVEHRLPFRISGGVRPYESSIDGCPDWVRLFPDQGILAGTGPAVDSDKTFFCTFRVTESDPGFRPARSVSYVLRLTVRPSTPFVSLSLPLLSKVSLTVGTFHSEALPAASGGVAPYTYSFTCAGGALPSGMGFAPATRMFAGTPDARFRDSCTLTVTDSSQPAVTASGAVEIEVTGGTPPLTLPPLRSKMSLTVGTFQSEALPAASGGVAPYTYSFTCAGGALPSGMGFAPATRMFAGTPDARFRDSCTLTVTDSSQPAVTASRAVEIRVTGGITPPLTLPRLPSKISLTVPEQGKSYCWNLPQRGAPGCFWRGRAVHVLLHLCRGGAALGDGLRARNPHVRRHSGRPLPRFLYAYGNGQLAARRDGLESRRGRSRNTAADTSSAPEQGKSYCWNLRQRGAPGCFWRGRAVHVLLHLCRGGAALGDGLRARNPHVRRHSGRPFPRFLHAYGNGQLAARRDGLESRRDQGDRRHHTAADTSSAPEHGKSHCWNLRQRGAPGCFWRGRAVHVLLHLCRGGAALGDGLRARNPNVRRHSGRPLPRFLHAYGNGQLAARRDGLESRRDRSDRRNTAADTSFAPEHGKSHCWNLPQRGAPGCFWRGRAVHVLLHLCRGSAALGDGLRARNPHVRRHSGRPLPRFLHAYGNGQLAARRDGLKSRRDRSRNTAADTSFAPEHGKSHCWNLPQPGAPGCFRRRRAVHVLLHLCRGALPSGMGFAPATRMFAGTPDARFRDSCTLTVTDSSQPAVTASRAVEVEVTGAATPPLTLPDVSCPKIRSIVCPLWCSSAPTCDVC